MFEYIIRHYKTETIQDKRNSRDSQTVKNEDKRNKYKP